jgi:hypothetical protein
MTAIPNVSGEADAPEIVCYGFVLFFYAYSLLRVR